MCLSTNCAENQPQRDQSLHFLSYCARCVASSLFRVVGLCCGCYCGCCSSASPHHLMFTIPCIFLAIQNSYPSPQFGSLRIGTCMATWCDLRASRLETHQVRTRAPCSGVLFFPALLAWASRQSSVPSVLVTNPPTQGWGGVQHLDAVCEGATLALQGRSTRSAASGETHEHSGHQQDPQRCRSQHCPATSMCRRQSKSRGSSV